MGREFACDGVIIEKGKLLLIKRAAQPGKGEWAVPGGRIELDEDAIGCLKREMKEETNLDVEPIALVGIYSDPKRDVRGVIAAAYLCKIIGGTLQHGDDAGEAKWFDLDKLPVLWADHGEIVKNAIWLIVNKHLKKAYNTLFESVNSGDFEKFIEHNELELALDELETAADNCRTTSGFWLELAGAAMLMNLKEHQKRYESVIERLKL